MSADPLARLARDWYMPGCKQSFFGLLLTVEERDALVAEVERLRAALAFYADPDSYFAIGFFPDRPCGEFMDDFSMVDDRVEVAYEREMPGKRARAALDSGENTQMSDAELGQQIYELIGLASDEWHERASVGDEVVSTHWQYIAERLSEHGILRDQLEQVGWHRLVPDDFGVSWRNTEPFDIPSWERVFRIKDEVEG